MTFLLPIRSWLSCVVVSCVLAAIPVSAAELAPDALIRQVTDEVLEIARNDKALQNGDTSRAIALIEVKVLPNFNFKRMTQLAVGKSWRQATPEQQTVLAEEFRKLLVRTYSKALTQYRDQTVAIKPSALAPAQTDARVKTEVQQPGAKAINIDYYLERADGGWRVYDIEVGGVSLVTNYRDSFATEIRDTGIPGLIESLKEKNRQGTGSAAKP